MRPPPGYPFVGPLKSRPPPPIEGGAEASSLGLAGFAVAFAGLLTGVGFLLVAIMVGQLRQGAGTLTPSSQRMAIEPTAAESTREELPAGADPSRRVVDQPGPSPIRNVPVHPARFLEGCSASDLDGIEEALSHSIGRGAPLFNGGDVAGCAEEYEQAATKLEAAIAPSCAGPVRALVAGRTTATKLAEPSAQAWAMRDAFDGLLEVIERSRSGGVDRL